MKYLLPLLLCVFLVDHFVYSAMSEKQMNATKKLVRNTCLQKSKASMEQVDGLQQGNFDLDKPGQCYLYCILNTYKLLRKDNSFDWEGGVQTLIANAPTNIAEPGAESVKNCKDAVKTSSEKCVAATEIAKCLYDDNPNNYFLP